ncbi:hypothetical protein [Alicyclobacillus macrosporangiidus]|uniref:hypothetical protein n=1 Tax=Alicyclobacillus macrosporangiidus TaxID=392015 RepID=UPI000495DB4D|nr:hypothetical protein [Alicyclobacillus macrosporangiidus]
MKWVLMALFLVILQFQSHLQVFNLEMEESDYHRVHDALQLATDDAVEMVTQDSVSNGQPVFDQTKADNAFRSTLANNLDLDPGTWQPKPNTMLKTAPQVLDEEFFDWSNANFPYHYVNTTYGIDVTMNEPSIVLVVQFTMPSYAANVKPFTMNIPVVASYHGH